MWMRLAVGAAAALLAGCATRPSVVMANPQAIMVRYAPTFGQGAPAQVAQAHCAGFGRNAVPTTATRDFGGMVVQSFVCR